MNVTISEFDIILRLCLGFAAGAIIGFERSSRRQVAGLRTHILIALGSTCLMLLSIWLPEKISGTNTADPGRIAAQVVSGMGFLGAGAIIRLGNNIKGLTTAASLWLVAAIGLAIGAGMFVAAGIAEVLALVALTVLNPVERKIFPDIKNKTMEIHYNRSAEADMENALEILRNFGIESHSLNVSMEQQKGKKNKVRFSAGIPESADISKLVRALKSSGDIRRVVIKESF